jgi:hypothetical protein
MLGVLGGMGPAATVDFLDKFVALTPAIRDQEHLPVLVNFAPQIPDRSAAILGNGPSPLPAMQRALHLLVAGGVRRSPFRAVRAITGTRSFRPAARCPSCTSLTPWRRRLANKQICIQS